MRGCRLTGTKGYDNSSQWLVSFSCLEHAACPRSEPSWVGSYQPPTGNSFTSYEPFQWSLFSILPPLPAMKPHEQEGFPRAQSLRYSCPRPLPFEYLVPCASRHTPPGHPATLPYPAATCTCLSDLPNLVVPLQPAQASLQSCNTAILQARKPASL